jgi:hypothetical protein
MSATPQSAEDFETRYQPLLEPFAGRLTASGLMAEAERMMELSDWGGPEFHETGFRERLGLICESLETEGALNAIGRTRARSRLLFNVAGRLGVVDWQRRNPDAPPIEAPLIGTGFGRSGTSFLHQLLGQDPDNNSAPMGECMIPCPPPGDPAVDAARFAFVGKLMDFHGIRAPEIEAIHPFQPENAAECGALQASAIGTEYQAFWAIPTYFARAHADIAELFAWEKAILQMMGSGKPGRRWLLKTPEHLAHWTAMVEAFPDARVYINHRDPAKTVPSSMSLLGTFQSLGTDRRFDIRQAAKSAVARMNSMDPVTAWRKAHPEFKVIDVHYTRMVADPIGEAERLYGEWGLTLTPRTRERMEAFVKTNRHAHGPKHRYTLADFGLTEADIEATFGGYLDEYGVVRERNGV